MGKLQFRRGNKSVLPTGDSGEPLLATDSEELFVGTPNGNRGITLKGSTTDYTIYVATSTYGGVPSSSGATGKPLLTGTADAGTGGTTLYDAAGAFTSAAHANKAIYNATTGVWSKVASVSSSTNLTLSVSGSFASGDTYVITNAFDNIPDAFNVADAGYNANITLRVSDGTFSNVLTLIGKTAGAAKTLTLQGSTTGTTTVSGETSIYQKISLKNITFTKRIFEYFGADVDWTTCVTSGDDGFLLLKSTSVANTFRTSSVIVIENDPAVYTSISSTVTKGYTIYVATSTYGGDDAVGDGLKITQGSATATTANKLVDSTANFNSTDHLNKTLYNSTDDTWAKITAIDSTTQVSISADIMASGEAYVIANAVATVQKAIDLIPGTVNCNTTVRLSNGTFPESLSVFGKNFSGSYSIPFYGTTTLLSEGTSSGTNTVVVLNDTGKTWTVDTYVEKLVYITGGTGTGQLRLIKSNTATALTIYRKWATIPDATSTYKVFDIGTDGLSISVKNGQKSVATWYIIFNKADAVNTFATAGATINLNGCRCTGGTDSVLRAGDGGTSINCFEVVAYSGPRCLIEGYAKIQINGTVIRSMTQQGVYTLSGGWFYPFEGNEIRNNTSHGILCENNSILQNIPTSESGRQNVYSNNGGWGVYVDSGSQASGLASGSFTGNTSGTYSANTAKYAYAS